MSGLVLVTGDRRARSPSSAVLPGAWAPASSGAACSWGYALHGARGARQDPAAARTPRPVRWWRAGTSATTRSLASSGPLDIS